MVGIILAGLLGTLVGSWVAYGVGRGGRLELLERHGDKVHMGPAQIERADRWFQRYGEPAVLFGRMIPVVRAFVSLPAGIARMPLGRFTVLTLIGSIPWVLGLALAGHALGGDWKSVRKGFEYVDYVLLALIVLGVGYLIVRRRRARPGAGRPSRRTAPPAPDRLPTRLDARPPRERDCRCATRSRSACCRGRPSCCRSPPPAHTTLIPWLLGWPYAELDRELRKSFEVALHAGAGARAGARHARRAAPTALRARSTRRRAWRTRRPRRWRLPPLAGLRAAGRVRSSDGSAARASIAAGLSPAAASRWRVGRRARGAAGATRRRTRDARPPPTGCALGARPGARAGPRRLAQRRHARPRALRGFARADSQRAVLARPAGDRSAPAR